MSIDPCLRLGATQQLAQMASGDLSAVALMEATLARIAQVNGQVNAIVSMVPPETLRQQAEAADRATTRGPLHGLPIAVKDLVQTAGIATSMGSPIFADHVPTLDDGLARRLRQAGAILIGKTNVPEFGLGSHSTNPVFGVTRNPYDLSRTAGGSSGGAGAALATSMVSLADGSDMMGSLRNPAGWGNVYSLRPSLGIVPAEPVGDTFLHFLATEGPMARTPDDLALLLSVLAAQDPRRPFGRPLPDMTAPAPRRIGWLGDWGGAYPMEPGILDLCASALAAMDVEVVELPAPFAAEELWHSWCTLRQFAIAGRLGAAYRAPKTRDLLNAQAIWEIERGLALSAEDVQQASEIRSRWFARTAAVFEEVDAMALPTAQVWPFPAEWAWPEVVAGQSMDTYHRWMEVVVPVSLIGVPAITVPAGFGAEGLPMGVQIFGPPGADGALLNLARAYHAATDWPGARPPILAASS